MEKGASMEPTLTGVSPGGSKPSSTRIDALDALRGLAVLGIFVVNIIGFSMPDIGFFNPKAAGGDGMLNYGLWSVSTVFVEGSMRGLFSLMFGAGVVLFTARAAYPDGPIRIADLFYRRTIWLIVFGLIHTYVFLMPGDILMIYGVAGLLLFPLRILSPVRLTILAGVILAGFVAHALSEELPQAAHGRAAAEIETQRQAGNEISAEDQAVLDEWAEMVEENWPPAEQIERQIGARTGDVATVYRTNTYIVALYSSLSDLFYWVSDAIMMMLLGMAFYKWRIITAERSFKFYLAMAALGYGFGLAFRIWAVAGRWEADFSPILWAWASFDQIGRVIMTIGHTGMFFVIWKLASSSLPLRALTAAGRMALTNYIGQTVIANLIFTGVGFGLYGALDRTGVHSIMLVIWVFQLTFSMWWLARYRMGPLEWGWRCLTYWQRQPLRK